MRYTLPAQSDGQLTRNIVISYYNKNAVDSITISKAVM